MISGATAAMALLMITLVTVLTHNLAIGVPTGVLLAALFFANKVSRFMYVRSDVQTLPDDQTLHRHYEVVGQVFFASAERFRKSFDFEEDLDTVTIDLTRAHFWDITSVAALDRVIINFRREGIAVEVVGMNEATATIVDRYAVHNEPDAVERLMGH